MSAGKGNQRPARGEDLLSDPFSLPQMRKLIGYILVLSWDCHFLSLWPAHQMVDSYRNQGAEEQTWTLETGRLGLAWGLGPGLKGLWDWGRLLCSAPPASLRGKFGKVISGPEARAPLEHGWPPTQGLQTNGFTWCDHYLMRCEGGRTQHKWHFPVERAIVDDVTAPCLREARENRDEQGSVCLLSRRAASGWVALLYSESQSLNFVWSERQKWLCGFLRAYRVKGSVSVVKGGADICQAEVTAACCRTTMKYIHCALCHFAIWSKMEQLPA